MMRGLGFLTIAAAALSQGSAYIVTPDAEISVASPTVANFAEKRSSIIIHATALPSGYAKPLVYGKFKNSQNQTLSLVYTLGKRIWDEFFGNGTVHAVSVTLNAGSNCTFYLDDVDHCKTPTEPAYVVGEKEPKEILFEDDQRPVRYRCEKVEG